MTIDNRYGGFFSYIRIERKMASKREKHTKMTHYRTITINNNKCNQLVCLSNLIANKIPALSIDRSLFGSKMYFSTVEDDETCKDTVQTILFVFGLTMKSDCIPGFEVDRHSLLYANAHFTQIAFSPENRTN